eukprot:snap_masked-scaffold199_size265817-processed-gene-1.10 protein:Tk08943 transcript:snap_masked-scaffold199_size265817-processed-gene-1.10-mRNA-1 annotation:"hypothetical protein TcasGA2_TC000206"
MSKMQDNFGQKLGVCEWIVQLIISQPSNTTRREALSCILRFAQASWNFGNFNGAMEILLGLR